MATGSKYSRGRATVGLADWLLSDTMNTLMPHRRAYRERDEPPPPIIGAPGEGLKR